MNSKQRAETLSPLGDDIEDCKFEFVMYAKKYHSVLVKTLNQISSDLQQSLTISIPVTSDNVSSKSTTPQFFASLLLDELNPTG